MKKKFVAVKKTENIKEKNFTLADCEQLCARNNYRQAFKILSGLASPGDPRSCYMLYRMYFNGLGTEKDILKAKEWLIKAAENNEPDAEYEYAVYFAPYQNQPEFSYEENFRWLKRAAEHGHAKAAVELAKLYFSGRGCTEDPARAEEIIKDVAAKNPEYSFNEEFGQLCYTSLKLQEAFPYLKKAFNEKRYSVSGILATYYMRGIAGVEQDVELAFQIIKKGAENKEGLCEFILASHYKSERNIRLAIRHFRSAYEHNVLEAAYELADLIMKDPLHTATDEKQVVRLLKKAAELPAANRYDALADLATCCYSGWGVEKDEKKAFEYYSRVLENKPDHKVAMFGLAICCKTGSGTAEDPARALELLTRAAELKAVPAQLELAEIYRDGTIAAKDQEKYISWLTQAAENGSDNAAFLLGNIFREGNSAPKDPNKAFSLFKRAADLGHIEAVRNVAKAYETGEGTEKDLNQSRLYGRIEKSLFGTTSGNISDLSADEISGEILSEKISEIITARYNADLPMYCAEFPVLRHHLTDNDDDLADIEPAGILE